MGYPLGFFFAAEYEGFEGRQGQNAVLCRRAAGSTADLTALGLGCQPCAAPKRRIPLSAPNEYNPNLKPILVGGAFALFMVVFYFKLVIIDKTTLVD